MPLWMASAAAWNWGIHWARPMQKSAPPNWERQGYLQLHPESRSDWCLQELPEYILREIEAKSQGRLQNVSPPGSCLTLDSRSTFANGNHRTA